MVALCNESGRVGSGTAWEVTVNENKWLEILAAIAHNTAYIGLSLIYIAVVLTVLTIAQCVK